MIDENLTMTLENKFIRTLVPSTAFDPSFEPGMAKAHQMVAGMVQSIPMPDFALVQ